jgi:hypothetical protein
MGWKPCLTKAFLGFSFASIAIEAAASRAADNRARYAWLRHEG